MVLERLPGRPLADLSDASADLWLGMGDALWKRNGSLAAGHSVLSRGYTVALCHRVGWIMSMQAKLIIFSGLPGTGKSTLANRLARELQVPLLCIDDLIGEVPEGAGTSFWDSKVAILLRLAEVQLELGLSVILDSVFMNMDRYHAQELARKYGPRFYPIYMFVSDDQVWEQRVRARYEDAKGIRVASWERIQHQRERFRTWESGTALFIDSLNPADKNYEAVLNFVMKNELALQPLEDLPLVEGKYHG